MQFGGLQKNTLIDYPGKIACVLFVAGCNFDCPYCHNPELVKGTVDKAVAFDENWAYNFLAKRKGFIDGVVISGGEPTLHKDLSLVCEALKKLGFPVKLDTNGSRPNVLKHLIEEKLVDYIAMDIKTDPASYSPHIQKDCDPETIHQSIQTIMASKLAYEFKTTCVKPLVNEAVIETVSRLIRGARRYALQQFQNTGVLHPEFFKDHPKQYGKEDLLRFKSIAELSVEECIVR